MPTQEVVDAVQAILGLMPPPKLAAAVQKLINCCPEARAALEEQVLSQDSRGTGEHSCPTSDGLWDFFQCDQKPPQQHMHLQLSQTVPNMVLIGMLIALTAQ